MCLLLEKNANHQILETNSFGNFMMIFMRSRMTLKWRLKFSKTNFRPWKNENDYVSELNSKLAYKLHKSRSEIERLKA